jgi:hypothetical protein
MRRRLARWRFATRRWLAVPAALTVGALVAVAVNPGDWATAESPVPVVVGGDRDCRDVEISDLTVRGGCPVEARAQKTRFTALTMFGDQPLGKCTLLFSLYASATGELAASDVTILTDTGADMGPCGDIVACRRTVDGRQRLEEKLPWTGRLGRDGNRLYAELDVCFDTCLGRFEGPARFGLEPAARGSWRMSSTGAAVGVSGLEIAGSWRLIAVPDGALRLDGR